MKEIVVISGKGGTGKTVLTGAFASLAENKVMADCDVDAADLHLIMAPEVKEKNEFKAGYTAFIDKTKCVGCYQCRDLCRFNGVKFDLTVDPVNCEGCYFCYHLCPANAIEMVENTTGEWYVSDTRFGTLVHARLGIAEENSGKLVTMVRNKAKEIAEKQNADWIIIDGTPGIGCPVIASISGVDCALVVTEPTQSGLHDAVRVMDVAKHFSVPVQLVVNKYDLNMEMTDKIMEYCSENNIPFAGKIKFDKSVVNAMVEGKTIIEGSEETVKETIISIWDSVKSGITHSSGQERKTK
jgi:MinD superfamily P-loop ATPase